MILRDRRLIVVHIQKTGGSSIAAALGLPQNPPEKHRTALELREIYGPETWARCLKVAVVRNPWDRLVSWWSMIERRRAAYEPDRMPMHFHGYVLSRASTFTEFLTNCDDEIADRDGRKWIWRNQLDYLTDRTGSLMVDYVVRFERLREDWPRIARAVLGDGKPLPRMNASPHRHYSSYYTPELAELVRQRYARDIAAFGYAFERETMDALRDTVSLGGATG